MIFDAFDELAAAPALGVAESLRAPFPWFGGKSRVAPQVWERFGDVANYVEPFFGSGAVLLGRPGWNPDVSWIETVNDLDGFVANAWRAIQAAPAEVARMADWPANENDLHARHAWLRERRELLSRRLEGDPDYYDAKIAGWWLWGLSIWIGSGFCGDSGSGPWGVVEDDEGTRQLVHLGDAGQGVSRGRMNSDGLLEYMGALSARLRRVRVASGDWARVCGMTPTYRIGLTGVFLDPPYSAEAGRDNGLYAVDDLSVAHDVRAWCLANGDNPLMRIALCGYDGEGHDELEAHGWTAHTWKAQGGYGSRGNGNGRANATREVVWFSPHCLRPAASAPTLFALEEYA